MEAIEPTNMPGLPMGVNDDSVLRWQIAEFLERWQQAESGDSITGGLFLLKLEDGRETRFFVQIKKPTLLSSLPPKRKLRGGHIQ
ncbi:hypothetical protein M3Y99_00735100 [Aphelenchoides fujianensis]|nr:hypothetical protein M3Y99_00735100 [Aphelenchoides fujianensis]